MSVDLAVLRIASMQPSPVEFGGTLTPALGGPRQRIDRIGSRWSIAFEMPPVRYDEEGMDWSGLLDAADRGGALIPIPQPGIAVGNPAAPVVASAIVGGRLLPLGGLPAGYVIERGRWLSIVSGGRRYADRVTERAVASTGGNATLRLRNQVRVALAGGETVELAEPKIEGTLEGWAGAQPDLSSFCVFSFTVTEDE